MDINNSIGNNKIDDKIANLLNNIKKISFKVGFVTCEVK